MRRHHFSSQHPNLGDEVRAFQRLVTTALSRCFFEPAVGASCPAASRGPKGMRNKVGAPPPFNTRAPLPDPLSFSAVLTRQRPPAGRPPALEAAELLEVVRTAIGHLPPAFFTGVDGPATAATFAAAAANVAAAASGASFGEPAQDLDGMPAEASVNAPIGAGPLANDAGGAIAPSAAEASPDPPGTILNTQMPAHDPRLMMHFDLWLLHAMLWCLAIPNAPKSILSEIQDTIGDVMSFMQDQAPDIIYFVRAFDHLLELALILNNRLRSMPASASNVAATQQTQRPAAVLSIAKYAASRLFWLACSDAPVSQTHISFDDAAHLARFMAHVLSNIDSMLRRKFHAVYPKLSKACSLLSKLICLPSSFTNKYFQMTLFPLVELALSSASVEQRTQLCEWSHFLVMGLLSSLRPALSSSQGSAGGPPLSSAETAAFAIGHDSAYPEDSEETTRIRLFHEAVGKCLDALVKLDTDWSHVGTQVQRLLEPALFASIKSRKLQFALVEIHTKILTKEPDLDESQRAAVARLAGDLRAQRELEIDVDPSAITVTYGDRKRRRIGGTMATAGVASGPLTTPFASLTPDSKINVLWSSVEAIALLESASISRDSLACMLENLRVLHPLSFSERFGALVAKVYSACLENVGEPARLSRSLTTMAACFSVADFRLDMDWLLSNTPLLPAIAAIPLFRNAASIVAAAITGASSTSRAIMSRFLRHSADSELKFVHFEGRDLLLTFLAHPDRNVRLQAGLALVCFVRIPNSTTSLENLTVLSDHIAQLARTHATPAFVETFVEIAGRLAQASQATAVDALMPLLSILIDQLGSPNFVIRSLAYSEICKIASSSGVSTAEMLRSSIEHWSQLAVSSIKQAPFVLKLVAQLCEQSPEAFLAATLQHTLPALVIDQDMQPIHAIAAVLKKKTSVMLVESGGFIMAHLLITSQDDDEVLIKFNRLVDAKSSSPLRLVRSCRLQLVTHLALELGNPSQAIRQSALRGLRQVESLLHPELVQPDASEPSPAFVNMFILGVITSINKIILGEDNPSLAFRIKALGGLRELVQLCGDGLSALSPHVVGVLQQASEDGKLWDAALLCWERLLRLLDKPDLIEFFPQASAVLMRIEPDCTPSQRALLVRIFEYLLIHSSCARDLTSRMICAVPESREWGDIAAAIKASKAAAVQTGLGEDGLGEAKIWHEMCSVASSLSNENAVVVETALTTLHQMLVDNCSSLSADLAEDKSSSAERIVKQLFETCHRYTTSSPAIARLCCKCLGALGAPDPDSFGTVFAADSDFGPQLDVSSPKDATAFACALIEKQLVPLFRSTHSTKMKGFLAFTIQELLKYCNFTPDVVRKEDFGRPRQAAKKGATADQPVTVEELERREMLRRAWESFPKSVITVIEPLVGAKYLAPETPPLLLAYPIYSHCDSARKWIESFALDTFSRMPTKHAFALFNILSNVIIEGETNIARLMLPHAVLDVLSSTGMHQQLHAEVLRDEVLAVLSDDREDDKFQLSAQVVFGLTDHLTKWVRIKRTQITKTRNAISRKTKNSGLVAAVAQLEEQVHSVETWLLSIPREAMARASEQAKAHARNLMYYEQYVREERATKSLDEMQPVYAKLQEIYASLEDADALDGMMSLVVSPTLRQQIVANETSGRWTDAETCYELALQLEPQNQEHRLGLMRCLQNLGHFDTLVTNIKGTLERGSTNVEELHTQGITAACRLGDWQLLRDFLARPHRADFNASVGRLLLAVLDNNADQVDQLLANARQQLSSFIAAAGMESYRRAYDTTVQLSMLHDVESMCHILRTDQPADVRNGQLTELLNNWDARLKAVTPSFHHRELILALHRSLLSIAESAHVTQSGTVSGWLSREQGDLWLQTAKNARKSGYFQTAFGAILQATQLQTPRVFVEHAKSLWTQGQHRQAIFELRRGIDLEAMAGGGGNGGAAFVSGGPGAGRMTPSQDRGTAVGTVQNVVLDTKSESAQQSTLIISEYQSISKEQPQWEKVFFHLGRYYDRLRESEAQKLPIQKAKGQQADEKLVERFNALNLQMRKLSTSLPTYQFLTAMPQLVSRICHKNQQVQQVIDTIILGVLGVYPQQTLWHLMSVSKSTVKSRARRVLSIFSKLKEANKLTDQLLHLCNFAIPRDVSIMSMSKDFKTLHRMTDLDMIIPLQSSMTVNLPTSSQTLTSHKPFPRDLPTIARFHDQIEVMSSLQRPRKITIQGSDGRDFIFLCKPADDLRKDSRLMEFNSMINRLLRKDPEARKRGLHIRTYAVVPLNEECGIIEWVRHTVGFRNILIKSYKAKNIYTHHTEIKQLMERKTPSQEEIFTSLILPKHPPVFHEWFIETFPEPSQWLSSRRTYSSTTAVMSMVGHIVGLGDRHGENILFDEQTGACLHVDLNCLFEKGLEFEKPERVPFRAFRKSCEVTLKVLQDNHGSLMSVLETFLHDPLCEWSKSRGRGAPREEHTEQENEKARRILHTIDRKLRGTPVSVGLPLGIEGQVDELISNATSAKNLSQMYIGWAPYL
nr:serine/threonine-protein kinase M1 [Polyrhizophydium stewartii]